jgi:SAM-dependent methyltransferase
MAISPTTVLIVLVVASLVVITWRLASRRHSLPCPVWLCWLVEIDNPFTKTNRAKFIVETLALALSKGMTALDAGCGPGRLTVPLAKGVGPNGCVVALDIQPGMLRVKVSPVHLDWNMLTNCWQKLNGKVFLPYSDQPYLRRRMRAASTIAHSL